MGKIDPESFVRSIDGGKTQYKNCLGLCNNILHRGYLTKKQANKHRCIEKNCSYFKPIKNNPYWVNKRKMDDEKARAKDVRRRYKDIEKNILEIAPKEIEPVFCKHLYDNVYVLIINKKNKGIPYWHLFDLDVFVYLQYIPKEKCQNIDVTFHIFLPTKMREEYINYKNDHKRHM